MSIMNSDCLKIELSNMSKREATNSNSICIINKLSHETIAVPD